MIGPNNNRRRTEINLWLRVKQQQWRYFDI